VNKHPSKASLAAVAALSENIKNGQVGFEINDGWNAAIDWDLDTMRAIMEAVIKADPQYVINYWMDVINEVADQSDLVKLHPDYEKAAI